MGALGFSQVVASALLRDRDLLGWPGSQYPSGFAIRVMERGLKSGTSQPCSRRGSGGALLPFQWELAGGAQVPRPPRPR